MWDNILLALQSLRSNKMRAILTMLGIIIGIGSVIAIKTVGSSLTGSITDSMSGLGVSNITVSLTQKDSDSSSQGGARVRMFKNSSPDDDDLITDDMIEAYRAAFPDNVAYVEETCSAGSASDTETDGDTTYRLSFTGVNDEYQEAEEVEILSGRALNNEKDAGRKVCVVPESYVEDVMGTSAVRAVGQQISVTLNNQPQTFYILGVYADSDDDDDSSDSSSDSSLSSLFGDAGDSGTAYLPMSTARTLSGSSAGYQSITVIAASGTDTSTFLQTTEDYFASYYTRNDTWTVEASSLESLVSTFTEILDTISLAISAIAAISLLVGGIGVMNIMLVSITERTREIGVRKALGAPRSAIRVQFIVESVVICLVGGAIGIAVGIGLGAIASHLLGFAAKPDIGTIVLAVGFSMAIGVFFGYYPADKAAKLDPIEALRYE